MINNTNNLIKIIRSILELAKTKKVHNTLTQTQPLINLYLIIIINSIKFKFFVYLMK